MKKRIALMIMLVVAISSFATTQDVYAAKSKFITAKRYVKFYAVKKSHNKEYGYYAQTAQINKITKSGRIKFSVSYKWGMMPNFAATNVIKAKLKGNKATFKWREVAQGQGNTGGTGKIILLRNGKIKIRMKQTWGKNASFEYGFLFDTKGKYITYSPVK